MKSQQTIVLGLCGLFLAACQPQTVYVPTPVYVEKKPAPKKVTYTPKPKPKPVETAEGFRAVEKPTTYSN